MTKKVTETTVFARPNLRLFALSAALLLGLAELIGNGGASGMQKAVPWLDSVNYLSKSELNRVIVEAQENPSCQRFLYISRCFERRRDYRKAMEYLRRADECDAPAVPEN